MATLDAAARTFLDAVAISLEVAAALVIVIAGARALIAFVPALVSRRMHNRAPENLRHQFGRSLLLGLDFAIGADIVKIAIDPTFQAALVTGLVVLIRTVLTAVLELEVRRTSDDSRAERGGA